ncbi:hypothetical protein GCM10027184_52510 [Saccharothrix stipae]
MVVIGVDPHKSSHTAAALDSGTHSTLEAIRVEATLAEYRRLLTWARRFDDRRWAVENARGLGRHLTQWLIARGETVVDVPPTATARVRELSRGGRRKNDVLDAAAAAGVAALRGDTAPVMAEDASTVLGMLDERRGNLTQQRTRTVNQLHALLRELLPGGVSTDLTAERASAALTGFRPVSPVERARKELARENAALICLARRRCDVLFAMLRNKTHYRHPETTPAPAAA